MSNSRTLNAFFILAVAFVLIGGLAESIYEREVAPIQLNDTTWANETARNRACMVLVFSNYYFGFWTVFVFEFAFLRKVFPKLRKPLRTPSRTPSALRYRIDGYRHFYSLVLLVAVGIGFLTLIRFQYWVFETETTFSWLLYAPPAVLFAFALINELVIYYLIIPTRIRRQIRFGCRQSGNAG